ncbi:MAG: sugar phosphate isomerase/epimerase [Planctomycetaceae bacterium]|nr:sugar phosphate isomerase/epimerase [Planctomycetaceae bacterium]
MLVAASTDCFADLPLDAALGKLLDLEFTCVEIALRESGNQLKPSQVLANLEEAIQACRETHRLKPVAYTTDFAAPDDATYYRQFAACCKLAKATRVVSITVRAGELGTPFNAEVERLRELVKIGAAEGVLVSVKSEIGHMTQDPATAIVLCDNVKGLGITLDPSHYVCGPLAGVNYDHTIKYVYHTQLRDSTKDKLQVRVGQGQIEYGRLVSQLSKVHYDRALAIDIRDLPDSGIDHHAELRKLRLLLESLM